MSGARGWGRTSSALCTMRASQMSREKNTRAWCGSPFAIEAPGFEPLGRNYLVGAAVITIGEGYRDPRRGPDDDLASFAAALALVRVAQAGR